MKNGLYSIHINMLDGVKGRDSGVLILRDGLLLGGGPYFWSIGAYTVGEGSWKGHLTTSQHTPLRTRSSGRCSAATRLPAAFPGPLRMTVPRRSARFWSAPAASAFARP
jgi:hypothetical protein